MRHTRRWAGAGVLLGWLLAALAAPAGTAPVPAEGLKSPLAQIPADSAIVIQVRGIEGVKDRLLAMIKNAAPDAVPFVQNQFNEMMGKAQGRLDKGLVKDGPHFIYLPKVPEGPSPTGAVILHVTSYREFLGGFLKEDERKTLKVDEAGYETATVDNETTYFINRKDYAVVTPDKEAAELAVKKGPGLDTKLRREAAAKLLGPDVSLYVDMGAVNEKYGDQIKQGRQLMEIGIQQAGAGGQLDENTLELVKHFYAGLFQAIEDSRLLLLSADFRPQGLAFHLEVGVAKDTPTDAVLKRGRESSLDELAKLPAGRASYTGAEVDGELFRLMQPWISGLMVGKEGKGAKAARAAFGQMIAAGPRIWTGCSAMSLRGGLQIQYARDPAQSAAGALKLYQSMEPGEGISTAALKEKPEVKPNAQTHRGFTLHYARFTWDFDKLAQGPGGKDMADAMKQYMGEGARIWFGTDGKILVSITAKDWAEARKLLDEYLDGKHTVGDEAGFRDARKQLPARASVLALLDVGRLGESLAPMMAGILKAQGKEVDPSKVKAPAAANFLGFALSLKAEHGALDFWLPSATVANIRHMIEPALKGGS